MAMKYKTVGGETPEGLPTDFTNLLQNALNGTTGTSSSVGQAANANPIASTQGIAGVLQDLLAGGAGKIGGSMQDMIRMTQRDNVNAVRSRFGTGGGTSFGTPAAYAESVIRAQEAPQLTQAIGGLQQGALAQLLPLLMGVYQQRTPQAQIVGQESPWLTAAKLGLQGAGVAASLATGNPFPAMAAKMGGGGSPSGMINAGTYTIPKNYYMNNNPFGR